VPDADHRWTSILDDFELRLGTYAATLCGGVSPEPRSFPSDLGPCPPALRGRATLLLERQHDVENALRARLGFLRTVIEGEAAPVAVGSLYIDAQA